MIIKVRSLESKKWFFKKKKNLLQQLPIRMINGAMIVSREIVDYSEIRDKWLA